MRRLVTGAVLARDDAADAAGLALMGLAHLGAWEVGPARARALAGGQWPSSQAVN